MFVVFHLYTHDMRHAIKKKRKKKQKKMPQSFIKRKPGRPRGSKNRLVEERERQQVKKQSVEKTLGRPRGSRNKNDSKRSIRKPARVSYATLYMDATGGGKGSATILDLLSLLEKKVAQIWTDDHVREFFGALKNSIDDEWEEVENTCHIYMSSKGRLVSADDNVLSTCVLFPGIALSAAFLEHYIHTSADAMTYGDFIRQTCRRLKRRAEALLA